MTKKTIIKFLITIIAMLAPFAPMDLSFAQKGQPLFIYIFLIDTSGSMVGQPQGSGNHIIFPKVKNALKEFIEDIKPKSRIVLYTFDEGIRESKIFEVRANSDIPSIQNYIDSLEAKGSNTWIYRSLKTAIDTVNLNRISNSTTTFYIFTDGLDNDHPSRTMKDIIDYFQLQSGDSDWLYYCTLGIELSPEDKKLIKDSRHVKLVEEKIDTVSPILLVEAKIPFLNFGNLFELGESERVETFNIFNKDKFSSTTKLNIDANFPILSNIGVGIEVEPKVSNFEEKKHIKLKLINQNSIVSEYYGEYEGVLNLSSNDSSVLIKPNEIKIKFVYEPESIMNVFCPHNQKFPIDFGELDTYVEKNPITKEQKLVFNYNEQALRKQGSFRMNIESSPDNPTSLRNGENLMVNDMKAENLTMHSPDKEAVFKVIVDTDMKPGNYEGSINLESDILTIKGDNLEGQEDNAQVLSIPWKFVIPKPPLLWWQKIGLGLGGLILILVIGLVVGSIITGDMPSSIIKRLFNLSRRNIIPSGTNLEVIEPFDLKGQQIDISEKKEVKMGKDGEYFDDVKETIVIRPEYENSYTYVKLIVQEGSVSIIKAGEREEKPVFEEKLFDGDIIKFGHYVLRLSSIDMEREIS